MKQFLYLMSIILLLTACTGKKAAYPSLTKDEITGARLWQRITAEEYYREYKGWPGVEGVRRGQSPHGRYHQIFINDDLFESLPLKDKKTPNGSIIVKENFDADKRQTNFTVMAKVKGYDPEHGDWFWAAIAPMGKVMMEGNPKFCIDCHEGKKDNDYLIVRPLDEPLKSP
jgi:hypothetical protein